VLARVGSSWHVRQRLMTGGLDRPLVTRIIPTGGSTAQNLAFIADRQGTTLAAVKVDGTRDQNVAYFGRNIFGKLEGAAGTGSSTNAETGFTGASTPNQTGGFTYLRNRWYDPQTGRFLTQDPIGLAGGVNLFAYAGNNPVAFTDPFGLCPPITSCLRKFNTAGRLLVVATLGTSMQHNGVVNIGTFPKGLQATFNGNHLSLTKDTKAGVGIVDDQLNAGGGFEGGVQWHKDGPDPIFSSGEINFGTGDFKVEGSFNNLPVDFTAQGNAMTGQGTATACVSGTQLCKNDIPFDLDEAE
jgi:RHS repeat-associated protein